MRTSADRRARVRLEVFGAFWGSFDAGDPVRVRNLSHLGALIESHRPLAVESVQSVCLVIDGERTLADARVCYVKPNDSPGGSRYLAGVEFVGAASAFLEAVDRLVAYRACPTEPA